MTKEASIQLLEDLIGRNTELISEITKVLQEVDKLTAAKPPSGIDSDVIRIAFENGIAAMVTRNKILAGRAHAIFQVQKLQAKLDELKGS